MNSLFLEYQLEIFIFLEISAIISLLIFGMIRYFFAKRKFSLVFIFLFIAITAAEAVFAWHLYSQTGEISSLQIIITIFVLYAITFGIQDFKKLDRWMRKKIGHWRGIDFLTDHDREVMEKQKNPKYIAHKYRKSSMAHILVFFAAQIIFFSLGTDSLKEAFSYLQDLSWLEKDSFVQSPYHNETIYKISMMWGIVFVVDTIYSWSYTFFPKKD
ncbi:hypothetical protein [Cytobacillus horneckiae]|uniref:hypothetical protein n=1 Tax=Cytobacillus horneckiae TaxID=549687 RepID=UPI003D9A8286